VFLVLEGVVSILRTLEHKRNFQGADIPGN
jgi:hypothetical protein